MAGHRLRAFSLDARRSGHTLKFPIARAEESEDFLGAISLADGGSVMCMARALLGANASGAGLRARLRLHQHNNTETHHLEITDSGALSRSSATPSALGASTDMHAAAKQPTSLQLAQHASGRLAPCGDGLSWRTWGGASRSR